MPTPPRLPALTLAGCLALATTLATTLAPAPAAAWTQRTQIAIVEMAAKLAPDDLARQIERHKAALREGVLDPFGDHAGSRHEANADGSGQLAEVVRTEARRAVAGIRGHRPFSEIVHQIGLVSHYVADLNDPLRVANLDPRENAYRGHYPRYLDGARGRFRVVYYPTGRRIGSSAEELDSLLARTLARGRQLYPAIAREYRRIGRDGGRFDDRSTAFGVGSLAYSHAVSDVAAMMRHIWLAAGGSDEGSLPRLAGDRLVLVGPGGAGR
jgi:hypothetical protein